MSAYKDQHWLPTSYLKYFSVDQQKCDSKSFVRRFDGKALRYVPVRSQCSADYHYSKKEATEIEQIFQKREKLYCQIVDRIHVGQEISGGEMGDLFICMIDLYLR